MLYDPSIFVVADACRRDTEISHSRGYIFLWRINTEAFDVTANDENENVPSYSLESSRETIPFINWRGSTLRFP
jgi:hypothetical protein